MKTRRPIRSVLIANRGEIAVRISRTLREMGLRSVAVASDPDRFALHALACDETLPIGGSAPRDSYLDQGKILDAARSAGVDAIHPGYGFLSENPAFAAAVEAAGLVWIGPPPAAISMMGDKLTAREAVARAGVPVVPGSTILDTGRSGLESASSMGYPVLIKAAAGGGGKGMRVVAGPEELPAALDAARRESLQAFGSDAVFLEKYLEGPRHIEFQIFADAYGNTVHLFERECSIQRRHQKILEESPSPALDPPLRRRMGEAAVAAARAAGYAGAGTVEFLLERERNFYFLEMNTRLQVEHPVTELTCGLDLVRHQILAARGEPLPFSQEELRSRGHALEVRVYAEDPANRFFPCSGRIAALAVPSGPGIRDDTGIYEGCEVSTFYDPMLGKLIVHAEDRPAAIDRLSRALSEYLIAGITTNIPFLADLAAHPAFRAGETATDFIPRHFPAWEPRAGREALAALMAALCRPAPRAASPRGGRNAFDIWSAQGARRA